MQALLSSVDIFMTYSDLIHSAVLWTCYLENYPKPERYLKLYQLTNQEVHLFDHLGQFFHFDEYYIRSSCSNADCAIEDLGSSKKQYILPWIYWPRGSNDTLCSKKIICPSADLFAYLDNKLEAKRLFRKLSIPTPDWGFVKNDKKMVEKPIRNSASGLNIRLTRDDSRPGYFLEEYIPEHRSIGLQFFIYDECEFICADEMLYPMGDSPAFTFHVQKNVHREELPEKLIEDSFTLCEHLRSLSYRGLCGIDSLVGNETHYLLEVNPRGIAFLPIYYAGVALGWSQFMSYMSDGDPEKGEVVLLDFGRRKKIIKGLS